MADESLKIRVELEGAEQASQGHVLKACSYCSFDTFRLAMRAPRAKMGCVSEPNNVVSHLPGFSCPLLLVKAAVPPTVMLG